MQLVHAQGQTSSLEEKKSPHHAEHQLTEAVKVVAAILWLTSSPWKEDSPHHAGHQQVGPMPPHPWTACHRRSGAALRRAPNHPALGRRQGHPLDGCEPPPAWLLACSCIAHPHQPVSTHCQPSHSVKIKLATLRLMKYRSSSDDQIAMRGPNCTAHVSNGMHEPAAVLLILICLEAPATC